MVPYRVKWLLWDCHMSTNCHKLSHKMNILEKAAAPEALKQ